MRKSAAGFTALESVLILIVIVVIGGIGWYALHTKRQTDKILSQADKISQSTPVSSKPSSKQSSSNNNGSSNSATSTPEYLVITEWGIKLPLTTAIDDAYYTVPENSQGFPNAYGLGTHALTTVDPNCAPDKTGVAFIYRQTAATHDQNAAHGDPENYPVYPTKVGNYYYSYTHSQAACSNNAGVNQKQASLFTPFQEAFDGITVE